MLLARHRPRGATVRYFDHLNMGEGVAGPDSIATRTTQLYNCMGIALVNRAKRFGGLYHYPSRRITSNPNVTGTIQQMSNDIKPDEIVLTPAPKMMGMGGSSETDIEDVIEFLTKLAKVTRTDDAYYTTAVLFWDKNGPVFNRSPGDSAKSEPVPQELRGTMNTGGRGLMAHIWYYGGDGEVSGVLDQNI